MLWTIDKVVRTAARKHGGREALVAGAQRLTYAELDRAVSRAAHHLHGLGLGPGDRVALKGRNSLPWVVGALGALRLGAVLVPMNHKLAPPESDYVVEHSGASLLLVDAELAETVAPETRRMARVVVLSEGHLDAVPLFEGPVPEDVSPAFDDADALAELLYTSGTTGKPKGCMHSHANVLLAGMASSLTYNLDQTHRVLIAMPIWHSFPLNNLLFGSFFVGATVVLLPEYHPRGFLEAIQQERCTLFFGAPIAYTMPLDVLSDFDSFDLSSMRVWIYGGGPIDAHTARRLSDRYRSEAFFQVFGMTEAGPAGTALRPEEQLTKAGSIGQFATAGCDLKVMENPELEVGPGGTGEIWMRCQSMMLGYWRDPAATDAAFHDGWYRTGDVAHVDADGYLFIVDRLRDMIVTGGENVYSKEVEDVLATHPDIAEVAVIGVPHETWGETVTAVVVLRKGSTFEPKIIRAWATKRLARFKVPRVFHVAQELPRTPSGKVTKGPLRDRYVTDR